MAGEARTAKKVYEATTLLASAERLATAGTNGSAVRLPVADAYAFVLDVTAAATDAADTLDVKVQALTDGTNWEDVAYFTQCIGTGGAKRYIMKIAPGDVAQAEFEVGTALTAGNVRHLTGDAWRVTWVIVDADADGAFTFSVTAIPM